MICHLDILFSSIVSKRLKSIAISWRQLLIVEKCKEHAGYFQLNKLVKKQKFHAEKEMNSALKSKIEALIVTAYRKAWHNEFFVPVTT